MSRIDAFNVVPPLVEHGCFKDLVQDGQTISMSVSPLDNALALFTTNANAVLPSQKNGAASTDEEQPIYFVSLDRPPSSERRLFITDTLIIFSAFRNLLKTGQEHEHSADWLENDQTLTMIRKLAIDYVNFIKECWVHASQPIVRPEGPLQFSSDHYRSLYTCFSLFVVLYLPEPGYDQAPVGDELMEWLNTHFIEPSTEEGDHLSSLKRPWEDETFWPYLTRAILRGLTKASLFFLGVISSHPSEDFRYLTETLTPLIESQPRLLNFTTERDFAHATRRWKDKVKALRIDMDRVPESKRSDDYENWWERLSDIVAILEGRPEVIKRVCDELGADWKEVCVAWTIFVDSRMRRQDLQDIVSDILVDLPPDPTSSEDNIHAALFSGLPVDALRYASELDPWLSAHLADIMEPLSLIESDVDEESSLSKRDEYILSYAQYLHSDSALWRITVDYMYSCGEVGKQQADEVLLRVPLKLREQASNPATADRIRAGDVFGVLKDVNETCLEFQRESVRRTVCRIAAQTFIQEKIFGLAASYCTSAEDWSGLGHIVDHVLEEYIHNGPQQFTQYALAISPMVQTLRSQPKSIGIFVHRLVFMVRYAHLQELLERHEYRDAASDLVLIFRDEIAPSSWWAVLLCDSTQLLQHEPELLFSSPQASLLLRKLEDITVRVSQGSSSDYLSILSRTIEGGGEKEALDRLKIVRLALARYFARCTVSSA